MEHLKQALEEALKRNEDENVRWQKYQEENEKAIDNLKMFSKNLKVDVMVPIGNKAFMPGHLYHTSEILFSHFRGHFSQLTSIKAQELLNHRIEMAKKRLAELEKEQEMYQNKLEVPYADGALPTEGERDIIEEVTEEEYQRQQEEHRKKLREYHQKKIAAKKEEPDEKSNDDYISKLEELELMEELEEELEKFSIDDEKLQKLLAGEIQLPTEKKRISHATNNEDLNAEDNEQKAEKATENNTSQDNTESFNSKKFKESLDANTKLINDVMAVLQPSNKVDFKGKLEREFLRHESSNRAQETVDKLTKYEDNSKDDVVENVSNDCPAKNSNSPKVSPNSSLTEIDDDDDRHPDINKMESEIAKLTNQEKLEYFRNRLKIYEEKVIIVKSVEDLERKCNHLEIIDYIKDAIEMLKHTIHEEQQASKSKKSIENRKRISFAAEDEVHIIDSDAVVSSVNKKKNVIEKITFENVEEPAIPKEVDKKKLILEKVEKNLEFVTETQSHNDFDMVGKIIGIQEEESKTLYLNFEHSSNRFASPGYTVDAASSDEKTIGSPSDIYKMFPEYFSDSSLDVPVASLTINEPDNNEDKKEIKSNCKNMNEATTSTDINLNCKNNKVNISFVENDQINNNVETTKPTVDNENSKEDVKTQAKSILKNKELVNQEKHLPIESEDDKENNQRKTKAKKKPQTTFKPIMGEVVEHRLDEPDPLPSGKLIDALAPKKRISRFRQARKNSL